MREVDLCRFRLSLSQGDDDGKFVLTLEDLLDPEEIWTLAALVDFSEAKTYTEAAVILDEAASSFRKLCEYRDNKCTK